MAADRQALRQRPPRPKPRIGFWEIGDPRIRRLLDTPPGALQPAVLVGTEETSPGWSAISAEQVLQAWQRVPDRGRQVPQSPAELMAAAVATGIVDGAVGGVETTSAEVLRAGLRYVGASGTVSMAMLLQPGPGPLPGRPMLLADCAVIPQPTESQLTDVALSAISTWESALIARPSVAFLGTTTNSAEPSDEARRIRAAVADVREARPDLEISGEIQADAALIPAIALSKGVRLHPADVLIFPNLASANISYKLLQHLAGYQITSITQGLRRPFFDLSRGADDSELLRTATACAIAAQTAAGTLDAS